MAAKIAAAKITASLANVVVTMIDIVTIISSTTVGVCRFGRAEVAMLPRMLTPRQQLTIDEVLATAEQGQGYGGSACSG